jgi:hypothetical protein
MLETHVQTMVQTPGQRTRPSIDWINLYAQDLVLQAIGAFVRVELLVSCVATAGRAPSN